MAPESNWGDLDPLAVDRIKANIRQAVVEGIEEALRADDMRATVIARQAEVWKSRLVWGSAVTTVGEKTAAFAGSEDMTIGTRAGLARNQGRRWGCLLC